MKTCSGCPVTVPCLGSWGKDILIAQCGTCHQFVGVRLLPHWNAHNRLYTGINFHDVNELPPTSKFSNLPWKDCRRWESVAFFKCTACISRARIRGNIYRLSIIDEASKFQPTTEEEGP